MNQNLEGIVLERSEALAISERQYRRIFEVSPDMILVVDSQGRIVDINPAGCRELGFGEPDASPKGERFQVFFEHDDLAATAGGHRERRVRDELGNHAATPGRSGHAIARQR